MTIYFPDTKVAFIHIPKNGGMSIDRWVTNCEGFDTRYRAQPHERIGRNFTAKHASCLEFENNFLKKYPGQDYRYFLVSRNPYSRMVSWQHFWREQMDRLQKMSENKAKFKGHPIPPRPENIYDGSFKNFVREVLKQPTGGKVRHPNFHLLVGQVWFLHPKKRPTWVLRLEHLEEDFKHIQRLCNRDMALPYENTSKHRPWQEYYDEETKDMVYNYFKRDFDWFRYEKDF